MYVIEDVVGYEYVVFDVVPDEYQHSFFSLVSLMMLRLNIIAFSNTAPKFSAYFFM